MMKPRENSAKCKFFSKFIENQRLRAIIAFAVVLQFSSSEIHQFPYVESVYTAD